MLKKAKLSLPAVAGTDKNSALGKAKRWLLPNGQERFGNVSFDSDYTPRLKKKIDTRRVHFERNSSLGYSQKRLSYKRYKRSRHSVSNLLVVDETPENSFEEYNSGDGSVPSWTSLQNESQVNLKSGKTNQLVDSLLMQVEASGQTKTKECCDAALSITNGQSSSSERIVIKETPEINKLTSGISLARHNKVASREKPTPSGAGSQKHAFNFGFSPQATSTPAETITINFTPRPRSKKRLKTSKMHDFGTQTTPGLHRCSIRPHTGWTMNKQQAILADLSSTDSLEEDQNSPANEDENEYEYALFLSPKQLSRKSLSSEKEDRNRKKKKKKKGVKIYASKRKRKTKAEISYENFIRELNEHYNEIEKHKLCIERV